MSQDKPLSKDSMKKQIVKAHIENDVNNSPTLVFTDEDGIEWVHEEQTSQHAGYITLLVMKSASWFFKPKNSAMNQDKPLLQNAKCTLTDQQLIDKTFEIVKSLCDTGGRSWTLQVPVNFNEDPDVLIIELGDRLKKYSAGASSSINGGVWVKASERLPVKKVIIQWFWEDGNSGVTKQDAEWIKKQQEYAKGKCIIEWLDESRPSLPKDNEGDKERAALFNLIKVSADEGFLAGCKSKEGEIKQLANTLQELVNLKDIKEKLEAGLPHDEYFKLNDEYLKRKPLAWVAARKLIADVTEAHFSDTLDSIIKGQLEKARERVKELEDALQKVVNWELPPTGQFWTDGIINREYSYESLYGSNGARDYMRKIAYQALAGK